MATRGILERGLRAGLVEEWHFYSLSLDQPVRCLNADDNYFRPFVIAAGDVVESSQLSPSISIEERPARILILSAMIDGGIQSKALPKELKATVQCITGSPCWREQILIQ